MIANNRNLFILKIFVQKSIDAIRRKNICTEDIEDQLKNDSSDKIEKFDPLVIYTHL